MDPLSASRRFDDEAEAIALANASPFALSSSVWTRNRARGRRIAARLSAGSCAVNDVIRTIANPYAAFGGNRLSGYGRYHGPEGLRAFSRVKTVMFASDRRKREINWFPFNSRTKRQLARLLKFRHGGKGIAARLRRPLLSLLVSTILSTAHAATTQALTHLAIDVGLTNHAHGELAYLIFASRYGFPGDREKAIRRGFLPIPDRAQQLRIETDLPPGTYAVSVYEDLNGNHKLDHNLIGIPNEPVGVSGNPIGRFGPPRFDECSFRLSSDPSNDQNHLGARIMTARAKSKRVVVIGAGLGGMSTAIMLARNGFQVTILEKNAQIGGKLNQLKTQGFSFDLGPSIFTLPQVFRPIFEGDGKQLEDYITLQRVDPQWRNFFEDGFVLDLWEDPERMRTELACFGPRVFDEYEQFLAYSRRQYDVVERGYLRHGLDTFSQFVRFYGLKDARDLDYLRSMSGSIYKRLSNQLSPRHLRILHQICGLQRALIARLHEPDAKYPAAVRPVVRGRRPLRARACLPQTSRGNRRHALSGA